MIKGRLLWPPLSTKRRSTMEKWKDVKGFEGAYQISSWGGLKSFKSDPCGRMLQTNNANGDYLSYVLIYGGKTKSTRIHRLVAEAFIPNPLNLPEVNHKDCDKQNNRVENLEWITRSGNVRHAIKNNPGMVLGMIHYNRYERPKTIQQYSLDNKLIAEYHNAKDASEATGACQRNILQVANKDEFKPGMTRKQAGGFRWRFKHEEERDKSASGY